MSNAPQYIIDRHNWVACMKIHGQKIWRAVGQYRLGANMGRRRVLKRQALRNKTAAIRYRKAFEERYTRLLSAYEFPTSGTQVEQSRAPMMGVKVKVGGSLTVERANDAESEPEGIAETAA